MKHIPNTITLSRMLLSVIVLFFIDNTVIIILLYLLCGFSDILDGFIARKTNTSSNIGAKLDSAADLLMFGMVVGLFVILGQKIDLREIYPLIVQVALIRIVSLLFAAFKYHSFVILHTWGNKLTGILAFLSPILLMLSLKFTVLYPIIIVAFLSAIEEGIIHIVTKQPHLNLNRRGLFWK